MLAGTESQLLGVADNLEAALLAVIDKYRVDAFDRLAGVEVGEIRVGVEHASLAVEVALFADTVARGMWEPRLVHDGIARRIREVAGHVAMTAVAGDRLARSRGTRGARMALEAIRVVTAVEIGSYVCLVPRSHIPRGEAPVGGNRRLEQVLAHAHHVTLSVVT